MGTILAMGKDDELELVAVLKAGTQRNQSLAARDVWTADFLRDFAIAMDLLERAYLLINQMVMANGPLEAVSESWEEYRSAQLRPLRDDIARILSAPFDLGGDEPAASD